MGKTVDLNEIYTKYRGLWVALNDTWDIVLGANSSAQKARDEAIKKGCNDPILFKVPTDTIAYFGFVDYGTCSA